MNSSKKTYTFDDLIDIMKVLRGDNGCPWDKAQDHQSIKYALLEEACEAMESLDKKGYDAFSDELGDVLLQVVFHSQIASENGTFTIDDVLYHICNKLITRHTHIFGNDKTNSSTEALDLWEENKKAEKGLRTQAEIMRDVCSYLPQLIRAEKIQKKAAKVGFDWDSIDGAYDKLNEEIEELKSAQNKENIEEEFGDILFSCVNIARFLNVNPEEALKKASDKFVNRFESLEKMAQDAGKDLNNMSLEEMDNLWDKIKSN